MRLEHRLLETTLRTPASTGHGCVQARELVAVSVHDEQGLTGFGEAAPLPSYDGVGVDEVLDALEDCRAVLSAAGADAPRQELLRDCARVAVLPQSVAAIDLALWDLEGRRRGLPVWRLLGCEHAAPVEVNATVAEPDRGGAAAAAAAAREAGFRCLKVKVGLGDDAGRLAAVRAAAGPAMVIRVDANGAWEPAEAVAALASLAPVGLELCEEPCHGLGAVAEVVADTEVPLALDESTRLPGALESRVCEAVCLKIAGCGGITGLLEAARRSRTAGYEVYLASTFDGPLGIAAALHAAAAVAPDRACGLATLGWFADREDPMPPQAGRMVTPAGAGLGEALPAWYG